MRRQAIQGDTLYPPGLCVGATCRSTAPGSRRRYRMEPPLRAAEYRLILAPRSDARPQAGSKAGDIISEE